MKFQRHSHVSKPLQGAGLHDIIGTTKRAYSAYNYDIKLLFCVWFVSNTLTQLVLI